MPEWMAYEYSMEPAGWSKAFPPELEVLDPPLQLKSQFVFLAIRPSGAKGREVGIATCPERGQTVTVTNYRPTSRHKAKKGWVFRTNRKPIPDGWYDNRRSPVMREHWVGNVMVERYDSVDVAPDRPAEHGGLLPVWGTYPDLPTNY